MTEKTLMLAKAIEVAQGLEMAAKNAKVLAQSEGASNLETVHRVMPAAGHQRKNTQSTRQKFTGPCFCYGKAGHKRATCRLKNAAAGGVARLVT